MPQLLESWRKLKKKLENFWEGSRFKHWNVNFAAIRQLNILVVLLVIQKSNEQIPHDFNCLIYNLIQLDRGWQILAMHAFLLLIKRELQPNPSITQMNIQCKTKSLRFCGQVKVTFIFTIYVWQDFLPIFHIKFPAVHLCQSLTLPTWNKAVMIMHTDGFEPLESSERNYIR